MKSTIIVAALLCVVVSAMPPMSNPGGLGGWPSRALRPNGPPNIGNSPMVDGGRGHECARKCVSPTKCPSREEIKKEIKESRKECRECINATCGSFERWNRTDIECVRDAFSDCSSCPGIPLRNRDRIINCTSCLKQCRRPGTESPRGRQFPGNNQLPFGVGRNGPFGGRPNADSAKLRECKKTCVTLMYCKSLEEMRRGMQAARNECRECVKEECEESDDAGCIAEARAECTECPPISYQDQMDMKKCKHCMKQCLPKQEKPNRRGPFSGGNNPFSGRRGPMAEGIGLTSGGFGPMSGGIGPFSGGRGPMAGGIGPFSGGRGPMSGGIGPFSGGRGPMSGGIGPFSGGRGPMSGGIGPFSSGRGPMSGGIGLFSGGRGPMAGGIGPFSGGRGPMSGGVGPFSGGRSPMSGGIGPFSGGRGPMAGGISPFPGGNGPFSGVIGPFAGGHGPMSGGKFLGGMLSRFGRGFPRRRMHHKFIMHLLKVISCSREDKNCDSCPSPKEQRMRVMNATLGCRKCVKDACGDIENDNTTDKEECIRKARIDCLQCPPLTDSEQMNKKKCLKCIMRCSPFGHRGGPGHRRGPFGPGSDGFFDIMMTISEGPVDAFSSMGGIMGVASGPALGGPFGQSDQTDPFSYQ